MRTVLLDNTLIHEYTEYEWSDKEDTFLKLDGEITEYRHRGVVAAEEAGKRWFQVLVKPNDELLDDSKPRNALHIDTYKYRANQKAHESDITTTSAIIGLMYRLLDAKYAPGVNHLVFAVPGYGHMGINIPKEDLTLFSNLPIVESKVKVTPVDRITLLEAVFTHDRKYNNG
jgi:hypothetical protein